MLSRFFEGIWSILWTSLLKSLKMMAISKFSSGNRLDAFQVDDFDIFRVDDQRRELDEFDQARGGRDDSRGRFVRDPVEC